MMEGLEGFEVFGRQEFQVGVAEFGTLRWALSDQLTTEDF